QTCALPISLQSSEIPDAGLRGILPQQEVDTEAADDASLCEHGTDAPPRLPAPAGGLLVRGETTARVNLSGAPPQDLVVRRKQDHFAVRIDPELNGGRGGSRALQKFLD